MRIAYHDPSIDPLANHVYSSMAEAGRRIGAELIRCPDERAIEACRPDFVLAVSSAMPKVADFPSYLMLREPKSLFLEDSDLMRNVLSFDGYLTIFDSVSRFIKDFCAGVRRPEEPGFADLAPQVSDMRYDWERPDPSDSLRVVYFGSNRTRRMPLLFTALDRSGILDIHGPEESWRPHGYASYRGPAAFDGAAPQRAYAQSGIGLALLDDRWRREDVVSNRIFEISSVGAVSICPDMPWTRKWFGDSVLYFDASRPAREVAEQVRAHHAFCVANPAIARCMGQAARRIFEAHFPAERMLTNAIDYHARKTADRARRRASMASAPPVSVIVRCGGRSLDMVGRAIGSIRRQTFGSFTVILAKYRDIDLSSITCDLSGAIVAFDAFLIEGGGRADMLWAGLRHIATPYFAVLDDDDFWLSDHMEELFRAGRWVAADFDVAYSGRIDFDCPLTSTGGTRTAARMGRFGFRETLVSAWQVASAIDVNGFVARTDLLGDAIQDVPMMSTAEDAVLVIIVSWRSKPVFSWRATAFYRADAADGSNWRHHRDRIEDDFSLAIRVGMSWSPRWLGNGMSESIDRVRGLSQHRRGSGTMGSQMHRLIPGTAGSRDGRGIVGRPGARGFVSEGPQTKLPAGRYMAVFLIAPNQSPEASPAPVQDVGEPIGAAEVVVMALDGARLALQAFDRDDAEFVLRFAVSEAWTASPIDLRVFAYGNFPFTVASIELHRDLEEPREAPPPEDAESASPDDDDAPADVAPADVSPADVSPADHVAACMDGGAAPVGVETDGPEAAPVAAYVDRDAPVDPGPLRIATASLCWRVIAPLRRLAAIARPRGWL